MTENEGKAGDAGAKPEDGEHRDMRGKDTGNPEINPGEAASVEGLVDAETDSVLDWSSGSEQVAALQSEVADLKDKLVRQVAETENVRKRAAKEKQDASKYAVSSFAADMLSVADNLRRALDAVPEQRRGESELIQNLLAGVEGTERELQHVFERAGIKPVNPIGEPFDPNFHEAMYEVPTNDYAPGTVAHVMQQGYMIHDRILRPARVGVAKPAEGEANSGKIDQSV